MTSAIRTTGKPVHKGIAMLEALNKYLGVMMATLTASAIIGLVGMYEFMGRMDERVTVLEEWQRSQAQVTSELVKIVAVMQDRQQRDGG